MTHKSLSLGEINRGFAGIRRFGQCPHCPVRCLETGLQKHINARHPAHAVLARPVQVPRVPLPIIAPPVQLAPPVQDQQEAVQQVPINPQEEVHQMPPPEEGLQDGFPEPLPQPLPLDPNIAEYSTLVGHFHRGAYNCHHTWKPLLKSIILTLLQDCVKDDEESATRGIAARQLLPGMVEYIRCFRRQKV